MTLEEMQNRIIELEKTNKDLESNYNTLNEQNSNLTKELTETKESNKKRIEELQEHNQKLFLKVTHKEEPKEDKNTKEFNSKLLGDSTKYLTDEELEILKQIEGEI